MVESPLVCPTCGALVPQDVTVCPDCHEDLAALVRLEYAHAVLYNEAVVLAREGHYDEALARGLLAAERMATFAPAHTLVAKLQARRGDWDRAQASIARALELAPGEPGTPGDAQVAQVAEDIDLARREHEARLRSERRAASARLDPNSAVHQLGVYKRDVRLAFGLGVGLAALGALVYSWLKGGDRR